ncbi:TrmH family RNA methyltransferase, partial [Brevundimonas naejangsanensis]
MTPIHVNDPDDPRIAAFRDVKERDLTGRHGLFIAEGEVVLRVLASEASRCTPVSILIAEKRLEKLREVLERLPGDVPVHVASQAVLNAVAGFDLHRGVLALGRKPEPVEPDVLLDNLLEQAVVVVACGIGNHDNMGGLFRNAAAFGVGA